MPLVDKVAEAIKKAKSPPVKVKKSDVQRAARKRERKRVKGPLVTLTVSDLLSIVKNRKSLLGSEMGDMRLFKMEKASPNPQGKQITFHGLSHGKGTENGKKVRKEQLYKTSIAFYSVSFKDEPDAEHPLTVTLSGGDHKAMEQLKKNKHPVQVRCNCMDFRMRWAYYDKQQRALLGKSFPKYVRKTDDWPEVNPGKYPGFCKHTISALNRLERERFLI